MTTVKHSLELTTGRLWSKADGGEQPRWWWMMVMKINTLLSRKCSGENKIRAKQARAMSGCDLFSSCARVVSAHVERSFVGAPWPLRGRLLPRLSESAHATRQMFTGADPNTLHLLLLFLSLVHVQQQQGGGSLQNGWVFFFPRRPRGWKEGLEERRVSHQLC